MEKTCRSNINKDKKSRKINSRLVQRKSKLKVKKTGRVGYCVEKDNEDKEAKDKSPISSISYVPPILPSDINSHFLQGIIEKYRELGQLGGCIEENCGNGVKSGISISTVSTFFGVVDNFEPSFQSLDEQFSYFYSSPSIIPFTPTEYHHNEFLKIQRILCIDSILILFNRLNFKKIIGDNVLFKCVYIFDEYLKRLQSYPLDDQEWKNIVGSCFLLACKYEEFILFNREEVESVLGVRRVGQLEWMISTTIDFRFAKVSPFEWIGWFIERMFSPHKDSNNILSSNPDIKIREKSVIKCTSINMYKKVLFYSELVLREDPKNLSIVVIFLCMGELESLFSMHDIIIDRLRILRIKESFEEIAIEGLNEETNLHLLRTLTSVKKFLTVDFYVLKDKLQISGAEWNIPFSECLER